MEKRGNNDYAIVQPSGRGHGAVAFHFSKEKARREVSVGKTEAWPIVTVGCWDGSVERTCGQYGSVVLKRHLDCILREGRGLQYVSLTATLG